jgi:hypothetical protein
VAVRTDLGEGHSACSPAKTRSGQLFCHQNQQPSLQAPTGSPISLSTWDAGIVEDCTNLVGDLNGLGLLRCLALLERRFKSLLDVGGQWLRRGDSHFELALVFCNQLVEPVDCPLGLSQAAVLAQHCKEILGHVRDLLLLPCRSIQLVESSRAVPQRQRWIANERRQLG